ncbi:MAG: 1-acyl-sn-glycerol-3-phosphate acyltransferase [Gemmatimonadales bacterium]|nr:1-acyl-sn-glycerol-3-phosphate acyltransferase [Gemmatimonadales bacterium]
MTRLWKVIASIWTWMLLAAAILIIFPLMVVTRIVTAPFDRGRYAVGRLFRYTAIISTAGNPLWHFRRTGVQIRDPRRPYVVVSNHESFADILMISYLPWEMKWLSKAELFRIPFVGWMMQLAGDIPVQRGFGPSAIEALAQCREVLANRVSVMIFPEGTRSPTGELLPFKDGAFRLAIEAGVPVLPLAVAGTRNALPKRGWVMGPSVAEVRVLEPIDTTGMTEADVGALRDRVRGLIGDAHATMVGARS